ncbi:MAG: transposase [Acholeplasmatales bacterium]|nr:transposase [Acholeplasmatales bacterium]
MDKESISRLGLDYINGRDSENSDEIYDPTTNNHNGYIISNGGMELANRDVKTIIRHAYGYTNFPRLRNRIMFIKNADAPILCNRKLFKI